jgi:uncharacterized protein (TIGR02172 family)
VIKLYSPKTHKEMVEEEVFFTNLARSHGLRVPLITSLVEDNGRWGYVYQRITGPTLLQWAVEQVETTFNEIPLAFAAMHREIHGHYDSRLPSIRSKLRSDIDAGRKVSARLRNRARRVLDDLPDGTCICHGDFHPENIIMAETGPMILDWVDAASGHHMADVVRTYMLLDAWLPTKVLEHGLDLPGTKMDFLRQGYRDAYLDLSDGEDDEFYRWLLPVTVARLCRGIPGEEDRLMRMIDEVV